MNIKWKFKLNQSGQEMSRLSQCFTTWFCPGWSYISFNGIQTCIVLQTNQTKSCLLKADGDLPVNFIQAIKCYIKIWQSSSELALKVRVRPEILCLFSKRASAIVFPVKTLYHQMAYEILNCKVIIFLKVPGFQQCT